MPGSKGDIRVLLVENSADDAELLVDHLQQYGYRVHFARVETAADMARELREHDWDLITSDFVMPAFSGLDALAIAREFNLDIPFIIVSGSIGEDLAVQAMRSGASDYLMKDRLARLGAAVERELEDSRIRRERNAMEGDLRHQAEELRVKAEQLQNINAELERFAYLAAHDLQEPLRMVAAYSQLLIKRYGGKLDEDADQIVSFIRAGVDRMESLIYGLLAYSKTLHEIPPALSPTPAEDVLLQAIRSLEERISLQHASITHGPLPLVLADGEKLRFVFEELLGNALTFRNTKPPVVHVEAQAIDGNVLFRVMDNGIGIDPQYSDQIFGLFKRLHRDDTSGLGMGLALCRRLIEQQGGRIWVESSLGEGSIFLFTLKSAHEAA